MRRGVLGVAGLVAAVIAGSGIAWGLTRDVQFPAVQPGRMFPFPMDHGAHPEFRTEWWYVTGWLNRANAAPVGFQVTFFRVRPGVDENNPSAFAAKQILFAHAALSDAAAGRLLHAERIYRAGFGLAQAATGDADIATGDWRLTRSADGKFHMKVSGHDFALDLTFTPTEPPMLEGEHGYSQKGPKPAEASYYYSVPNLNVSGTLMRNDAAQSVSGTAWLDREWSSDYLDPRAIGWDWTGLNLADGSALMAFRIRGAGKENIWAGGTLRESDGTVHALGAGDLAFRPVRRWHSPQTGADYPVETVVRVHLPGGDRQWRLTPLFDNQEYDARGTGGPVYWEGAVRAPGATGYLELTGYFHPLKM